MDSQITYHLRELEIARNPIDSRHVMPRIAEEDRLILDIGCGIGQTLSAYELGQGQLPIGMDMDFESLSYGKKQFHAISFVSGTAENLPFRSNSVDLVMSRVTLPYTNIPKSVKEINRVLKTNGKVWLVLHPFRKATKDLIISMMHLRPKNIVFGFYVLLNGMALHFRGIQFATPFGRRFESFQTKSAMARLLMLEGFTKINIRTDKHFVVTAIKKSGSKGCET